MSGPPVGTARAADATTAASATSALAATRVQHRRLRPRRHALTHRTLHLLVDVDDLARLDRDVTGFGVDRRAAVALRATDHLAGRPGPLRTQLAALVARAGATLPAGRLQLLAHPRMLGHAFNPVAWWFAHHPDGRLGLVVAEVTSTFGDRALYVLDDLTAGPDGLLRATAPKRLHVSPFLPVAGLTYRFAFLPPDRTRDDRVLVHMEVRDDEGTVLTATQDARLQPFDSPTLRRLALRHPVAPLMALLHIHRHALHLWRLRVPFHRRPAPPSDALRRRRRPTGVADDPPSDPPTAPPARGSTP